MKFVPLNLQTITRNCHQEERGYGLWTGRPVWASTNS